MYSRKPIEREDVWCYERGNFCYIGDYDASDWRNSLIKRPANHENNEPDTEVKQLPKLTVDIFGRADCPAWAQWAAVVLI